MRVCVYCSSSDAVDAAFVEAARDLGREIATRGHELVYGGASVGLMGEVARAVDAAGGRVTGIIPRPFADRDLLFKEADEIIITDTMAERKALMIERSDAFVALPGGFGTLEELSEVLTLKQLGQLSGALVLLNTGAFYDRLLVFFEQIFSLAFARPEYRSLYYLAADARAALCHIEGYVPVALPDKWF